MNERLRDGNEIFQEYNALINDYLQTENISEANLIKNIIIQKASQELSRSNLSRLQSNITQMALRESGRRKMRLYELNAGLYNQTSGISQTQDLETNDISQIDFRVIRWSMRISDRDYVIDPRDTPQITPLGNNTYELTLVFRRNSKSSLRWPEHVKIHFSYDGVELIFFWDKNRNQNFDRNESWVRYIIRHKEEWVRQQNRRFIQPRTVDIQLSRDQISSHQRVRDLQFQILFQ